MGKEVELRTFLNLTLDGGDGLSVSGEREPGTHWVGGSLGPRAGCDAIETDFAAVQPVGWSQC
jgi:hypothetical protein